MKNGKHQQIKKKSKVMKCTRFGRRLNVALNGNCLRRWDVLYATKVAELTTGQNVSPDILFELNMLVTSS